MKITIDKKVLLTLLARRGESVDAFCKRTRIAPRTIQRACDGQAVTVKSLSKISAALDVDVQILLSAVEEKI